MTDDITQLSNRFLAALPHAKMLGLSVQKAAAGSIAVAMPYHKDLVGDRDTGVIHGGAVSALMDTAGGAAVVTHPGGGLGTATLDLRIDYMRPATPGQTIVAKAECHHATRSVAFVRAVAYDDDTSRPVATATGAFTVPTQKVTL